MCWSLPLMEQLVEQRLADARAASARQRLLCSLRPPPPPLRATLGAWLGGVAKRLRASTPSVGSTSLRPARRA
jgi:hypothetical protein